MKRVAYSLGLALLTATTPAVASTVVNGSCVSVLDSSGCLFNGNINSNGNGNQNSYVSAQNAYNLYNDTHPSAQPDILLTVLAASDDANFSSYGSFTYDPMSGNTSGTWTLNGYLANFVAVKASNNFVLYELATPASMGTWDTFDIPYMRNPHALSHLVFFGTKAPQGPVPEPATWAMMIFGFGAIGGAMRRRKTAVRSTTLRYA